jgi:hypothetical protein
LKRIPVPRVLPVRLRPTASARTVGERGRRAVAVEKIALTLPPGVNMGGWVTRPHGPIDPVELRNRVVSELHRRASWVRVDELAVALEIDLLTLVRVLRVLHAQEHIEVDGKGCVRRVPAREEESRPSTPTTGRFSKAGQGRYK